MDEVLKRMEKIELLLEAQYKQNNKLKRFNKIQSILLLIIVIVFSIGIILLNNTVSNATKELPILINTATQSVALTSEELQIVLKNISSIDFDALNKAIMDINKGVDSLNFEALSSNIDKLEQVVRKISSVFGVS